MRDKVERFKKFGYPSDKSCWMCNNKPAKSEPRFGYLACVDCCHHTPVEFNYAPFRPNES